MYIHTHTVPDYPQCIANSAFFFRFPIENWGVNPLATLELYVPVLSSPIHFSIVYQMPPTVDSALNRVGSNPQKMLWGTLWYLKIAIENGSFIDDFPKK